MCDWAERENSAEDLLVKDSQKTRLQATGLSPRSSCHFDLKNPSKQAEGRDKGQKVPQELMVCS